MGTTMGSSTVSASASSCRMTTFPPPLSVLLVEHDRACLLILKRMLLLCNYHVTSCRDANEAQSLIQSNKDSFDIALCEVHLPGTSGLELLDVVVHQTDIPVVMISSDLANDVVRRAMMGGARDYLAKPVRKHSLEHLWRHLLGKEKWRSYIASINGDAHGLGKHKEAKEESIGTSIFSQGNIEERRRRELTVSWKGPKISWTPELHQKFVSAVNQLGTKAFPKSIVRVMGVPGLTARHVASHLQKYRIALKKATPPVAVASSTPLAPVATDKAENSRIAAMSRPGLVQHQPHQSTPVIGLDSDGMDSCLMHQSLTPLSSIHTDSPVSFQAGMNLPLPYPNHMQATSSQCNTWISQDWDHAGFDRGKSIPLIGLDVGARDDFLMHQSNASGSFTLPSYGSFYQDNQMNHLLASQDHLVPAQYVNGGVLTDADTILGPYVGSGGEATMDTDNDSKALTLYQSSHVGTSQSMVTDIYDDLDESIEDLLNMFWYN